MSLNYKQLGRRIKEVRKMRNMTQMELSELVGISEPHLSRIETGTKRVSFETFVRIANALAVTCDSLLYGNQRHDRLQYKKELSALLDDCNSFEKRIIFDIADTTKKSIRQNAWLFMVKAAPYTGGDRNMNEDIVGQAPHAVEEFFSDQQSTSNCGDQSC